MAIDLTIPDRLDDLPWNVLSYGNVLGFVSPTAVAIQQQTGERERGRQEGKCHQHRCGTLRSEITNTGADRQTDRHTEEEGRRRKWVQMGFLWIPSMGSFGRFEEKSRVTEPNPVE